MATESKKAVALRGTAGETPWMGLPGVRADGEATTMELMEAAGLTGWNVRKRLIETDARPLGGEDYEVLADINGEVRRMSVAGERYHEVQNEDLAVMGDTITDGGASLYVAGSLRNYRTIFLGFSLGDDIVLDPEGQADRIGQYMNLMTSHDGTIGVGGFTSALRLECQNQLTSQKSNALGKFTFRHTRNVTGRIEAARKALSISFRATEELQKEMEFLIQQEMSDRKFWALVKRLYPEPEEDVKGSLTKWTNKTDAIVAAWNDEKGNMSNLDKTAYRAYNALNEHLFWGGTIRAENEEGVFARAGGFDNATNEKNLALVKAVRAAVS